MDPQTPSGPAGNLDGDSAPLEAPSQDAREVTSEVELVVARPVTELVVKLPPVKAHPVARFIQRIGLGAFTTSILIHLGFLVLAFFSLYKWIYPPEEKIDFLPGGGGGGEGGQTHKIQHTVRQRMASAAVPTTRISSSSDNAAFALPDASRDMLDAGVPMELGSGSGGGAGGGSGGGIGAGFGVGTGPGKGFGEGQLGIGALIPTIMKGRCTDSERMRMLREAGGTEQVEHAVKKSLAWFKSKQNKDGSWGSSNKPAMTGLVLLCFLGHCESAQSGDYGQTVFEGIIFLIEQASKNQGRMMSTMEGNAGVYEHAIATYALAEALCYSRSLQFPLPELETTVQRAAEIIIKGQTTEGGWDYGYVSKGRNDLSVAGWQLQALKAAKVSGVKLEELDSCIRKATEWLSKDAYVADGKFGYTGKSPKPAMTAVAALCLQHLDKGNSKPAREAVKLMHDGLKLRAKDKKAKDKPKVEEKDKDKDDDKDKEKSELKEGDYAPLYAMHYDSENSDLYAWYYFVQAMRNAGGEEWELTNKAILEDILPAQKPDGSFRPEKGGGPLSGPGASRNRTIYLEALNTLILEVYYRFLPATSAGKSHSSRFDDMRLR